MTTSILWECSPFLLAEEWRAMQPTTPQEIRAFYSQTENTIFDLAMWHQLPHIRTQTECIVRFCVEQQQVRVVDYGCGIAEEGIALAEAGCDVTLVDIPGQTFDFAKWRAKQRGLNVTCIDAIHDAPLQEMYDSIICLEVLEHLWDCPGTVRHLRGHLHPLGFLIATISFSHTESHPMHLAKNDRYQGEAFLQMMQERGFTLTDANFGPMVFQAHIPRTELLG